MPLLRRTLLLATAGSPLAAAAARAQAPARATRIIVPFPPGGTTDILARDLAQLMAEGRGTTVVVENKSGAGGTIGSADVARAVPDGTTLLLTATHHVINPSLMRSLPYDPRADFTPLALVATVPNALVVHPSVPARSVAELVAYVKANPGRLSFGSTGVGGANHLAGELFKAMAGLDIVHVPYRGAAPAMTDLLGGQIPMMFDSLPTVLPHLATGRLRALAVTSATRAPSAPDLPTMDEAGIRGFEATAWFGLYGPGGMAPPVADRVAAEAREVLTSPAVRERFAGQGAEPGTLDRAAFARFVLAEMDKWRGVVERAGVRIE
ncbi:tripartite tricarboxylate transporter substrate binding protein [Falsiroseomonas oryzae]|uniref:tripartite tricarboxylate transporter substrate binding protein n=1 Tax=Falsiroseomonas oryzae TaxID=2766473 RepID=UPI0022EA344F|nr:tripartite tricarboxylate transporter substrate binding protein [Roseomonas sp. MO-31]